MNFVVSVVLGVFLGFFLEKYFSDLYFFQKSKKIKKDFEDRINYSKEKAEKIILESEEKSRGILQDLSKKESDFLLFIKEKENYLNSKEDKLNSSLESLNLKNKNLDSKIEEVNKKDLEIQNKIESIAKLSEEEAKKILFDDIQKKYQEDLKTSLFKLEHERKELVEKRANEIIATCLERYTRVSLDDYTTMIFELPSEDFKGKIIGKEGRNVKALERATGVEILVDDTPDSIVISSFDPMRRELARMTLERLVKDGRIQPAKIEEFVALAEKDIENRIYELGEKACYELNINDFPREIIKVLGRLHFRTSYGQNVLDHSIEMAHIAGMLAGELGLNVEVAKKGALVHDIGKALDQEIEGTHIEIGRRLLKKYGVDDRVVLAMEAHHGDYPHAIPEAFVVTTADVISGSRRGARRDSVEMYLKRLKDLELIASSFSSVKSSYVISGGRELRVFVNTEKVDDFGALELARNIATKIQSDIRYPGEIKVVVIRETKAIEYAK